MLPIDFDWRAEHFASRSKRTNSFCNFRRTERDVVYRALSSSAETLKYFNSCKTFSLGKKIYCKKGKQLIYGTK